MNRKDFDDPLSGSNEKRASSAYSTDEVSPGTVGRQWLARAYYANLWACSAGWALRCCYRGCCLLCCCCCCCHRGKEGSPRTASRRLCSQSVYVAHCSGHRSEASWPCASISTGKFCCVRHRVYREAVPCRVVVRLGNKQCNGMPLPLLSYIVYSLCFPLHGVSPPLSENRQVINRQVPEHRSGTKLVRVKFFSFFLGNDDEGYSLVCWVG